MIPRRLLATRSGEVAPNSGSAKIMDLGAPALALAELGLDHRLIRYGHFGKPTQGVRHSLLGRLKLIAVLQRRPHF